MRVFGQWLITPLLAFFGGFTMYSFVLKQVWDEDLGGDKTAVMFWGAVAFLVVATPIYYGVVALVSRYAKKATWFFTTISCILVFFIPTSAILLFFGSTAIFSPEAMLFHAFFATSGLLFGLCYAFFEYFFKKKINM